MKKIFTGREAVPYKAYQSLTPKISLQVMGAFCQVSLGVLAFISVY